MTNEIENTRFIMYNALHALRKAKKHPKMLANFESVLEDYLEALRKDASWSQARIGELYSEVQQWKDIADVRQSSIERDQNDLMKLRQANTEIQDRLHAVDRAYFEQSKRNGEQARQIEKLEELNRITGEELRECQTNLRHWREEAGKLNSRITAFESGEMYQKLKREGRQHLEDCRSAEKLSDDLSEKLTSATTVIGQQEQLIAGQRSAIAGMHAELTHSRVIRKAFIGAQEAFAVLDSALHSSATYSSHKALGDDVLDAEFML